MSKINKVLVTGSGPIIIGQEAIAGRLADVGQPTPGPFRLWQPGFYDFNIYSEEKLDYIHNNPVSAGLVLSSGDYEWSSYHLYFSEERKANTAVSAEQWKYC
ncbi:MAG: hypothetical protein KAH98_02530 [Dehalococcoidia bacterium]|nr:hypothetical protein [Dehalococcoidia bacterium]MCK5653992.1 hypothetical protein [Dehalococcoidia bacterium]